MCCFLIRREKLPLIHSCTCSILYPKAGLSRFGINQKKNVQKLTSDPFVVSSALHWGLVLKKKTWPAGGKTSPGHCCDREDLLTQAEKTPRTPAPPWHGHHCPVRTGPGLFDLCFGCGTDKGIFFYPQPEICSHGESNPGPEGCYSSALTVSA